MTDGNDPAPTRPDPRPQPRAPAQGLPGPPTTSAPRAHEPSTRTSSSSRGASQLASRPAGRRPSPATTFPGSFQQGEETGVGREKPGGEASHREGAEGAPDGGLPAAWPGDPDTYPHVRRSEVRPLRRSPHHTDAAKPPLRRRGLFTHACSPLLPRPRWRRGRAWERAGGGRPGRRASSGSDRRRRAEVIERRPALRGRSHPGAGGGVLA